MNSISGRPMQLSSRWISKPTSDCWMISTTTNIAAASNTLIRLFRQRECFGTCRMMRRIWRITIYEVSDSELEILAKGSPDSTYLDFSIGLLSAAIAFSITLATNTIESNRTFTVFFIAVILGYLFGFLFLLLWWKNHTSVSSVVTSIRSRLPPEGKVLSINEAILPT